MRRFGDPESFLRLIDQIRSAAPAAGVRSNVICGFPGESDADLAELHDFLTAAQLDAIGVFGYSDEEGTEASRLDGAHSAAEVEARRARTADLAEELVSQRAASRIGEPVRILIEEVEPELTGRAAHQAPEVDGSVRLLGAHRPQVGELLDAAVVDSEGADLVAEVQPRW
jgi:tRNA A37 methylthiotransferase MiaB